MSSIVNNTNSTFPELNNKEWSLAELLLALLLGTITLVTIFGNSLVIYLFTKSKRALRSPTHWLIASLAVADLNVGVFSLPILTSLTFNDFKWTHGELICHFGQYVHFWLCATSLLSMMTVSVERYLGVRFPLRHKRILTKKRVIKMILLTWILGLCLTSIPLSIWPNNEGKEQEGYCRVNLRPDFALFLSLSVFFTPLFVTCIMNWQTYRQAVKLYVPQGQGATKKHFSNNLHSRHSSPVSKSNASSKSSRRKQNKKRSMKTDKERYLDTKQKQTQLAKKLGVTVGIMLTLYAPMFTVFFIAGIDPALITSKVMLSVSWIRYMSYCINPVIYIIVIPGYKQAFFRIIWYEQSSGVVDTSKTGSRVKSKRIRQISLTSESESESYTSSSSSGMNNMSTSYSGHPTTFVTFTSDPTCVNIRKHGSSDYDLNFDSNFDSGSNPQCLNCGILITDSLKGDEERQICGICNIRHEPRMKSYTDVKHLKMVSRPSVEDTIELSHPIDGKIEDPLGTPKSIRSTGRGSLVYELRAFVKDMEKRKLSGSEENREVIFRNRASQLLSNIVNIIHPDVEEHIEDNSYCKIDKLRRSIVRPISYRKSQILSTINTPNASKVRDLEELKELDDILESIEKELVSFEQSTHHGN